MTDLPPWTKPLDEPAPLGNLDMSGYARRPDIPQGPAEVGDIYRTRQGRLYVIMSLPGTFTAWRTSLYAQHVAIEPSGALGRFSQTMLSYVESNWEKVGHLNITFSDPEWYI